MALERPAEEGESPVSEIQEDKSVSRVPRDTGNLVGISGEKLGKLGNLEKLGKALPTFIPKLTKLIKLPNKLASSQHDPNFLSKGA